MREYERGGPILMLPDCADEWFGSSPAAKSHSSVPGRVDRSMYAAAQHFGTAVADSGIVDSICACSDWLGCCVR